MAVAAARVRPLEEYFSILDQHNQPLTADKTVNLAVQHGDVLVLCQSPPFRTPIPLAVYQVDDLKLTQSLDKDYLRWSLADTTGGWYEGLTKAVDIYRGLVFVKATDPLKYRRTSEGLRAVLQFQLPSQFRLHYIDYLRKEFPETVRRLKDIQ